VTIKFHQLAEREAFDAQDYYDTARSGTGLQFQIELDSRLDQLSQNPLFGHSCGTYRRLNLKVFPYYIAYTVEGELLRV
jgi:hypothetical protein